MGSPLLVYDVMSIFQDGGQVAHPIHGSAHNYFQLQLLVEWRYLSRNVEFYLHTTLRSSISLDLGLDISIPSWDITTSGFWKQTTAVLEFYFLFRFLPTYRHQHVIVHRRTNSPKSNNVRQCYDVISILQDCV